MISTPPIFVLPEPIDNTSCPPPKPPSYMKHQVYDNPNVFEKVDYHAIRVARNTYPTFRDFLWDLVFRYKLNELEKARVIFRWMTSCDMTTLNFQTIPKGSPEEVLLSLKNLKGSYANALELMCSYSGLFCLTISGYAKGVDYRPGDIFKEQAFNHSWNVIYIQDSWQLIDAHWATRYLTARKNTQDSIVYQYDDFYFIMEPQQAVYSHFPQDSAWQLMKEPLNINQFENLPLTKSQFFKCGMDFHNQHHGVVHSKDGNLKMNLGFWKPDSFTYKLVTDKNSDVFQGVPLKYFVIQETVNNQINFYFRFPMAGNYYLTIFVQELNEHNMPVNQENVFRAACEYKIIADKAADNSSPYPTTCHDLNWGPQWSLISHYNLVPVQEDGVISIKSPDGKPMVVTEVKFNKMRDDVGLLCKLRKNGVEDEEVLDQYVKIIEKSDQTTFVLSLPEPGEYGLEIYANEPSEGDTFTHVCQYLLDFEPPPGYKQQSSVFGPVNTGSVMLNNKPSNIRDMYNYEKDASPLGALPKPYLLTQYAPEDATMIPGQTKNKPKPFAYNKTTKSDESDMEMPDFLPPPPSVNVIVHSEPSSASYPPPGDNLVKSNGKFGQPQSSDNVVNQFNSASRPISGHTGAYTPQSQTMLSGDNVGPATFKGDNYASLQGAKPFTKAYAGENVQIKIGESVYNPAGQKKGHDEKSDDELMEQTVRLQPYLASVEKGLSPQLSRKVHDYSVKVKTSDPKDSSIKFGGKGQDDTKFHPPPGSNSSQGRSFETVNTSDSFSVYKMDDPNNDGKRPSVFRGYGRPNFTAGQTDLEQSNPVGVQKNSPFKDENSRIVDPTFTSGSYGVRNPGDSDKSAVNPSWQRSSPHRELTAGVQVTGPGSATKVSNPGYQAGVYSSPNAGESGDSRKDPKRISNIAVTLSPSGFKKPNQAGSTSDQYNNQFEDKSKIIPSPIQKYRPDNSTANWTSGPVQKEPPKNFQLEPINIEEKIYKPEVQALPEEAPIGANFSPEESSKIFQRIDDHAIQISGQHQENFNELIWQLIYARNITDELEKVRVIFLWLCTKDLHKMNFDDIKKDSPEEILMGLNSGKSTYAQIFLTLCRYANLHCKLIVGYAKGADYVPGMKFQARQGEHSWNAVMISGVWRLVDCHWAARRLIGKERKPENVRYELDMFYFLANPSQLIYTHFPQESDWQLLHHSVTIDEFESLAPVKSMFFKYNLDLVTHKNAVIDSTVPEFELKIAFPKDVDGRLQFTFTLTFNDGTETHNGVQLIRYGRQEMDHVNSLASFFIRAPIPGSYKLLLFAKLGSADPSAADPGNQNMFGAICEYKIEFNFPSQLAKLPFPSCQTSTYGPSEVSKRYHIEACVTKSNVYTENGTAEFKFLISKPDTRVIAKLITNSSKNSDQLTEQCVLQRVVANEEAIINVFLPEPGEYGLEVYANDPKTDGNSFYTVWQYFLVSASASIVDGLPSLPPGYMGPYEPKFSNYGLSAYSHKDPFIVANTGDLCVQLKTTRERPVRIMTQLIHCSHNVAETCANQVLQQARDSLVFFLLRFPHRGFFKLQIFALPYSEMTESLPGVFNYLIEANQPSTQRLEFPQQFAQWKEGCYLYEPTDGVLGVTERPDSIKFSMDVPRATSLAVVMDGEWTRLAKDQNGTWSASVDMRLAWSKASVDQLTVCANYGASMDDSFTTILKYSIQ